MAWQPEMTTLIRILIDDLDGTTYSDSRLEELILAAAQFMLTQVTFVDEYTIDIERHLLTPDPTEREDKDNDFINLVSIKASVILLGSEIRTLSSQAYRISDGPATIDVSSVIKAKTDFYDKMKKDLDSAVLQYQIGNGSGGQAILTPYTTAISDRNYTYVSRCN